MPTRRSDIYSEITAQPIGAIEADPSKRRVACASHELAPNRLAATRIRADRNSLVQSSGSRLRITSFPQRRASSTAANALIPAIDGSSAASTGLRRP